MGLHVFQQLARSIGSHFQQRYLAFQSMTWSEYGFFARQVALHGFNAGCAVHLISSYIGRPSTMLGPSMLPTLGMEGELVIEDRISYWLNPKLTRGDLVILQSPLYPGVPICKRIFGLPGDIVCVDPTGRIAPSTEHTVVPKGHVWIIGDNAAYSRDSRNYGPVPISLIQGRLFARIWPLNKAIIFKNPTTYLD